MKYRIDLLIPSTISAEEKASNIENLKAMINNMDGTIENIDDIGTTKLAYEINQQTEGCYIFFDIDIDASNEKLLQIENNLNKNDIILRHLVCPASNDIIKGGTVRKGLFSKEPCKFCDDQEYIFDHRNASILKKFILENGKIIPNRILKCCKKHHKTLLSEVQRARILAILPFIVD